MTNEVALPTWRAELHTACGCSQVIILTCPTDRTPLRIISQPLVYRKHIVWPVPTARDRQKDVDVRQFQLRDFEIKEPGLVSWAIYDEVREE